MVHIYGTLFATRLFGIKLHYAVITSLITLNYNDAFRFDSYAYL